MFVKCKAALLWGAAASSLVAAPASALVYDPALLIQGDAVAGPTETETEGARNARIAERPVEWSLERPTQRHAYDVTGDASDMTSFGSGLGATATQLLADFGVSGPVLFRTAESGIGGGRLCVEDEACAMPRAYVVVASISARSLRD